MKSHLGPTPWHELASEPEFRALLRSRRRFIIPATLFYVAYYLALPVSVAWFPMAMSRPLLGPLTVAYCFALSQFAMTWILLALYLWKARTFDVRAARMRRRETQELLEPDR